MIMIKTSLRLERGLLEYLLRAAARMDEPQQLANHREIALDSPLRDDAVFDLLHVMVPKLGRIGVKMRCKHLECCEPPVVLGAAQERCRFSRPEPADGGQLEPQQMQLRCISVDRVQLPRSLCKQAQYRATGPADGNDTIVRPDLQCGHLDGGILPILPIEESRCRHGWT